MPMPMDDREFCRLIRSAMCRNGWLLPTTAEDVRAAEAYMKAHPIELPESLRDPFKVLEEGVFASAPATFNASTSFPPVTLDDILATVRKVMPPRDEPIMAFEGTADQLRAAVDAENARNGVAPLIGPSDTFWGLDVGEEDGWVYIGTTKQLHEARDRWGSLGEARRVFESLQAARGKPDGRRNGT
jgi:hypothetical protein